MLYESSNNTFEEEDAMILFEEENEGSEQNIHFKKNTLIYV